MRKRLGIWFGSRSMEERTLCALIASLKSIDQYKTEAEIRNCRQCHSLVRLRVGTVLENSKSKVLTWVRAIFLVMDSKRGISAKELQGKLNTSYK